MNRPEELADDLARRDAEWMKWESEIVQLIVDQLHPLLIANYPGSGWFRITITNAKCKARTSPWASVRSAFGKDLNQLFTAVDAAFKPTGWQMRGRYDDYSDISFNFRPLSQSDGVMERFLSPDAVANIDLQTLTLPTPPSHVRPTQRGHDSAITGVVLKQLASSDNSTEPFIYEHFC
jgi:hypothetical protein